MLNRQTFLDLARTWKYCGLPDNTEFIFANGTTREDFVDYTGYLLHAKTIEDAESYFYGVLVKAIVPGCVEYR